GALLLVAGGPGALLLVAGGPGALLLVSGATHLCHNLWHWDVVTGCWTQMRYTML
ncbi:hypothetical protein LSAT2_029214, partial [Lamellibrachia satsuma]